MTLTAERPSRLFRTRDLAEILGVSKSTIRRFVRAGMPVQRVGGQFRFDGAAVQRWLDGSAGPRTRCRICGAVDSAEPVASTAA